LKTESAAESFFTQELSAAWKHFCLENGVGSAPEMGFKDSAYAYKK
jgi:hypothetical protein